MKAVIYARYSSDNQTEASIEGQLRECMEFAERTEIDVVGNYIDRALTAKTDNRPEFQRMIKDSYKHAFDCIIVWKLNFLAVTIEVVQACVLRWIFYLIVYRGKRMQGFF